MIITLMNWLCFVSTALVAFFGFAYMPLHWKNHGAFDRAFALLAFVGVALACLRFAALLLADAMPVLAEFAQQ